MAALSILAHLTRPASVLDLPVALWSQLTFWHGVAVERRALRVLDGDHLADIGLERDAAEKEAARPFWDARRHWRKR